MYHNFWLSFSLLFNQSLDTNNNLRLLYQQSEDFAKLIANILHEKRFAIKIIIIVHSLNY